jgi:hypothetical protein
MKKLLSIILLLILLAVFAVKQNHDSAWVGTQTSLTGGNVNISVGGKTTITGAEIAAGEYDENGQFVDNGQLNLATNELEYKDLHDFNTSKESGFGLSTNLGGSTDANKATLNPDGKTTISVKKTGSETEQTTHATVGAGTITVGGTELANDDASLAGLNRDVAITQAVTKDEVNKGYAIDMELDVVAIYEMSKDFNGYISAQSEEAGENIDYVLEKGEQAVEWVGDVIDIMFPPEKPESQEYSKTFTNLTQDTSYYAKDGFKLETDTPVWSTTFDPETHTYTSYNNITGEVHSFRDGPIESLYPVEEILVGGPIIGKAIGWVGKVTGVTQAVGGAISSATSAVGSWVSGLFGKAAKETVQKGIKVGAVNGVENSLVVTGYTKHGINQAISRDGVGTSASAVNNAIRHPLSITKDAARNSVKIKGKDATVIINNKGKVITNYGKPRN